ncbi:MAG: hypothetical protein Q9169_002520 [Polycauliona sp. 2 TL-2023]
MSFGWSISDIALLVQLAYKTTQGARAACGQYDELTQETTSLHVVLKRLAVEAAKPGNPINKDKSHGNELGAIANGCKDILTQLDKVLIKYNALSEQDRSVRRLWKKIRFSNGVIADVAVLRSKLTYYTSSLTLFLNMVSLGTVGQIEEKMEKAGGDLQDIKNAVNNIAAHLLATAGKEGSVLTAHTDDDRDAWRELRRRLRTDGFQDSLIRKHMHTIMAYVKELGDRGVFDNTNINEFSGDGQLPDLSKGESDNTNTVETRGDGKMPNPSKGASLASESDRGGSASDRDPSEPSRIPQQPKTPKKDEHDIIHTSDAENTPSDSDDPPDLMWKLKNLYGYEYSLGHRFEIPRYVASLHNRVIHVVNPSLTARIEAFLFRVISIDTGGLGPVIENARGQGLRIMHDIFESFGDDTRHFLRSLSRAGHQHALCKLLSVVNVRSENARRSSRSILEDMNNWSQRFNDEFQCRAVVDARWRRFKTIHLPWVPWEGTEFGQALYGNPLVEEFDTLRVWHDNNERWQTDASILFRRIYEEYVQYDHFKHLRLDAKAKPDLPAFVADRTVIHKMDEIRAISDVYSQSLEVPGRWEVRLLCTMEKLEPIPPEILSAKIYWKEWHFTDVMYWTPNTLAILALALCLEEEVTSHAPPSRQGRFFRPGLFSRACRINAVDTLKALNALELPPPNFDAAIISLYEHTMSVQYVMGDELEQETSLPDITIHRLPNNAVP